jgi:hypothetical protein
MATIDSLVKNMEELENVSYKSFLDVSQYFAPDKICVKYLLKAKFPNLKDASIDDIVDDEVLGLTKIDEEIALEEQELEKILNERELSEVESENDDAAKRQSRREQRDQIREEARKKREEKKELLKRNLQERKKIFKDRLTEYIEEVKKIKRDIRQSVHKMFAEFFNLAQKLVTGLVKSVQTLIAVIGIIVAPPWNIPNAICLLISVVEFFLDIIKQLKVVAPIMEPLRQLGIVIPPDKLGVVSSILNPVIKFILGLFKPFSKFDVLVGKLMDKLTSIMGDDSKKRRVFKKATRKLRKYKYCQNGDINKVDDDDLDEVQELLETYKLGECGSGAGRAGFTVNRCNKCVVGYRNDEAPDNASEPETDESGNYTRDGNGNFTTPPTVVTSGEKLDAGEFSLSDSGDFSSIKDGDGNQTTISGQLEEFRKYRDIEGKISASIENAEETGNFLYDVLLPDGTLLANQTQANIDKLKNEYTLLFTNFE